MTTESPREFPYRPRTRLIVAILVGSVTLFPALALHAASDPYGLVLFHLIDLDAAQTLKFYWGLCAFGVAAGLSLVAHRVFFEQRVVLEADQLLAPKSRWSKVVVPIPYRDVVKLDLQTIQSSTFLHVVHPGGKVSLQNVMFESDPVFDQFFHALEAAVRDAKRIEKTFE